MDIPPSLTSNDATSAFTFMNADMIAMADHASNIIATKQPRGDGLLS